MVLGTVLAMQRLGKMLGTERGRRLPGIEELELEQVPGRIVYRMSCSSCWGTGVRRMCCILGGILASLRRS